MIARVHMHRAITSLCNFVINRFSEFDISRGNTTRREKPLPLIPRRPYPYSFDQIHGAAPRVVATSVAAGMRS